MAGIIRSPLIHTRTHRTEARLLVLFGAFNKYVTHVRVRVRVRAYVRHAHHETVMAFSHPTAADPRPAPAPPTLLLPPMRWPRYYISTRTLSLGYVVFR